MVAAFTSAFQRGRGWPPLPAQITIINHQAAVLHHLESRSGQLLSHFIMTYARLEPYRLRLLRQDIFNVLRDVPWATKNID